MDAAPAATAAAITAVVTAAATDTTTARLPLASPPHRRLQLPLLAAPARDAAGSMVDIPGIARNAATSSSLRPCVRSVQLH